MRVATNTFSTSLLAELQKLTAQQNLYTQQLSRGTTAEVASENPLSFAQVKGTESQLSAMKSANQNHERAELINELSTDYLGYLKDVVDEGVNAANLLNASVQNATEMEASATFLDTLIDQTVEVLRVRNGDNYLFSGDSLLTDPLSLNTDPNTGQVVQGGSITWETGDPFPSLTNGNWYRIDDPRGADFTGSGAANNEAGELFQYNGTAPVWVQGGPTALTPLAPMVTEATADDLEVGAAYQIIARGENTDLTNAGAPSNALGAQFIYNGEDPLNWDGASLAKLRLNPDGVVREQDYVPFEYYRVTSGDADSFEDVAAADTLITDTFQYNGGALTGTDAQAEATLLARPVTEATRERLLDGQLYQIVDMSSSAIFTGGGADIGAQVGDIFEFDAADTITDWADATLIPLEADDLTFYDSFVPGPLVTGQFYEIRGTGGGDNFAALSTPPNAGAVGTVFEYNGVPASFGTGTLSPIPASYDENFLSAADVGTAFIIVGGTGTFSGGGAGINATAGTRFVYDGSPIQPADFGGATLTPLSDEPNDEPLQADKLYKIIDPSPAGRELPALTKGDDLVAGKTYRIDSLGASANFTGAFNEAGPYSEGDLVTATGLQPVTWDGSELKSLVLQTAGPISNDYLQAGTSYQIASVATASVDILYDATLGQQLAAGQTYTITAVDANTDFTNSGAPANTVGTTFTYNGTPPVWGAGQLGQTIPATDFTGAGASSNAVGTSFTANGEFPVWGNTGTVYIYRPERTQESDFVAIGASSNDLGTVFNYNGNTPAFENINATGGGLVTYELSTQAAEYVGSSTNNAAYTVATGIEINPYLDGADAQRLADVVNQLVQMRDAFEIAADAADDDFVAQNIARALISEAAANLDTSRSLVQRAQNDVAMDALALDFAERKDIALYQSLSNYRSQQIDVDQATVVTQLQQTQTAYEAALSAGAQRLNISLLNFI